VSFVVEGLVHFPRASDDRRARFTAEFAEVELPVIESSNLGLAGAWILPGDTGTDLLHLYGPVSGLADLTASARWIAQLPPDHPYLRLYEWITGADIRYARTVRPLVDPVDQGWWERRVQVPLAAPYFVATSRYGLTGERTFRRGLSTALRAIDAADHVSVAMAYDTLFGDFGSTRVIGTAPTAEIFDAVLNAHTAQSAADRDPWVITAAVPVPYSPLR
jgi:hypothetical protein